MTFGVRDTINSPWQALFHALCLGAASVLSAVPRDKDCVDISQGQKFLVTAVRGDKKASTECSAPRASLLRGISPTVMTVLLIGISCPGACGARIGVRCI